MAADWIKMRVDLQSHPKVVRILSALGADKFRVIGGLHAAWAVFDTHSVDGVLDGYSPKALDHVIGWDGFADAMIAVNWLSVDGQALVMPEFTEHNGQSAKRRAEDQKRKRDGRNPVRILSAECPQESGLEKRREEKSIDQEQDQKKKQPPESVASCFNLPEWIDSEAWGGFIAMRKRKRANPTDRAKTLIVAKLAKIGADGHDITKVLDQSTANAWTDVYPIKEQGNAASQPRESASGRAERKGNEHLARLEEAERRGDGAILAKDGGYLRS